jgi:hypothetical protein
MSTARGEPHLSSVCRPPTPTVAAAIHTAAQSRKDLRCSGFSLRGRGKFEAASSAGPRHAHQRAPVRSVNGYSKDRFGIDLAAGTHRLGHRLTETPANTQSANPRMLPQTQIRIPSTHPRALHQQRPRLWSVGGLPKSLELGNVSALLRTPEKCCAAEMLSKDTLTSILAALIQHSQQLPARRAAM